MSRSSMKRLASKIIDQFSHESIIEVYVLDEEGKPLELYAGMPAGLTSHFFEEVLTKPLTFYCFSIVGIDETFADLLDIHRDKLSRKEFCWLTDPQPPTLVNRTESSISLSINLVDFCGVDVSVVEDSMEYVLEGCMGQPWQPGIAARYVTDIGNPEYKVIARGPKLSDVVVNDLQPSTWYHFRLCVQYSGTWVISESKPFATLNARPCKPNQPSVYLVMNGNDMFQNRSRVDPQIRLCWGPPRCNGLEIRKYLVQTREYTLEEVSKLSLTSSTAESDIYNANEILEEEDDGVEDDASNILCDDDGFRYVGSKWKTVYCHMVSEVILKQPKKSSKAWACRLKALNAQGWSDYSDPLILDFLSHPKLFKIEEPSSPRVLPPLNGEKSGLESARTDSSCANTARSSSRQSSARLDYTSSKRKSRNLSVSSTAINSERGPHNLLLPRDSPAFKYEMNPEAGVQWLTEFPDKKMAEVLEPEIDLLWAWTNINKDFIRYVVASAVCERAGEDENENESLEST